MNVNHKLFIKTGYFWGKYHYFIPVEANNQSICTMFSSQTVKINVEKVHIVLFKTKNFWHKAVDIPVLKNINKL